MKHLYCLVLGFALAASVRAAELLPVEQQVAEAVKAQTATIVHFWAPWCPNCNAELADNAWGKFITANPDVKFIFVTIYSEDIGRDLLAKRGVGSQKNFQLLQHPNPSRIDGQKMTSFMGLPLTSTPVTWVFRGGKVRYALNHGEVRFPMLKQLVADALNKWER